MREERRILAAADDETDVMLLQEASWHLRKRSAVLLLGLTLLCGGGYVAEVRAGEARSRASLVASPEPGWPQFRGRRRDGVSDERGLLPAWPEAGPRLIWTMPGAGRGFSSPIVVDGRIYVTGDFDGEVRIVASDLDGKPLWSAKNGAAWLNQYPGARSSVTYSGGRVYHQNAHGRVACYTAADGREVWSINVLERFRGENITWGLSENLLVDERAVYVTAGGRDALLVALDKTGGEVIWKSEPLAGPEAGGASETAGYAAPILVRFAGRKLIVGCSSRHVFCADADTGMLQWTRPRPTSYSVLAMTPVLVEDAVFVTAPFGPPGALLQLTTPSSSAEKIGVKDVWTTALDTAQGGVVGADGKLFGSFYPRRGGWAALDATDGNVLYDAPDLIKGSAVFADGRLYVLSEDGAMHLFEPTARSFEPRGKFRLTTARDRDAWAHPVIHAGRLYLRYHDNVHCYDIRDSAYRRAAE